MFIGPGRSRQVQPVNDDQAGRSAAAPDRPARAQLTPREHQKNSVANIKLTERELTITQGELSRVKQGIRENTARRIGHPADAALEQLQRDEVALAESLTLHQTMRATQIAAWRDEYPEVDTPGTTKTELKARVKEIGVPFVRLVNRAGELQAKMEKNDVEDWREARSDLNSMASHLKRMAPDWNTLAEQWGTHCPEETMPCGKMKFRPEFHSESSAYVHEATFHPVK